MIFVLHFFVQDTDEQKILGDWDLRHYDAIQKIKSSPRYQLGDPKARNAMDRQFEEMMKNGRYSFVKDTLDYTDMEGTQIRYRVALWRMKDQILYITEIDRPFSRRAFIHHLSSDSLVMSPIIDNAVGDSKMIFRKNRERSVED